MITTVYLYQWQVQWMDSNGKNRSDFIRGAVSRLIEIENGYDRRLEGLKKTHDELLSRVASLEAEILEVELEGKRAYDEAESDKVRSLIRRIRLVHGIDDRNQIFSMVLEKTDLPSSLLWELIDSQHKL